MIRVALIVSALALLVFTYVLPEMARADDGQSPAARAQQHKRLMACQSQGPTAIKWRKKAVYAQSAQSCSRTKRGRATAYAYARGHYDGYHAGYHAGEIAAYRRLYAHGPIRTLLNGHRRIVRLVPRNYYSDSWLYDHHPRIHGT